MIKLLQKFPYADLHNSSSQNKSFSLLIHYYNTSTHNTQELPGKPRYQVAAQSGHNVSLVELDFDLLKKADAAINNSLTRIAKKLHKDKLAADDFISETRSRLKGTTNLNEAVEDVDLVIEAIVENLETKQKLFATIDEVAKPKTIFASNTSSLSIGEIALNTKRKDRFGGLHFFSPVPVMRLLEVVRTPETSQEVHDELMAFGKAIGKTCISCKDTPGFVVNRLLVPYMNEAVKMYERGDADFKDIDIAMKLGAGYPMGPFELADFTGLDVGVFIIEGWHKKFPDEPLFSPPKLTKKLVEEGKLGVKSGEGFYKYNK